jgi:sodium transport system permease protein
MNNSLSRMAVVFNKEVMDNLRDRRSMFSAMISSLIGPALLLILIVIVGRSIFKDQDEPAFDLYLMGQENAPNLVEFFQQNGANILPAPVDPEAAVRNGDVDVVLIIPEGYGDDFDQGAPATVRMVYDSTRQSAIASNQRVRNLLDGYNQQIGVLRLLARGISPVVINPLAVENVDVATPQTQALIFLNMMPYFIVMVVFMGGMYVIIDTTAGERERASLEPLLINPVSRAEFVLGLPCLSPSSP